MMSTLFRVLRPAVAIFLFLYVGLCAVIFVVMHGPPAAMAPFMDRVPGVFWAVLPLESMWTYVNRGPLEPGDVAPDFELATVDGRERVRLSSLRGKPVVLMFGSYTCPPFRKRMPDMNSLYEPHKDRAHFYFVYVEEAHATDEWPMERNTQDGVVYARHQQIADRMKAGGACAAGLKIPFPMLVDDMDNHVGHTYRAWPIRVYVIDKDGRIAFKTRTGPFGFQADEVRPHIARVAGPVA